MIQMTLIQIDNYGPWTVTPKPRNESDLQILQAELYADVQRQFAAKKGLVFFTRFDNMLAITNGISKEDHFRIQRSIRNRYPITISMGVSTGDTPYKAQKLATETLQKKGGAQSAERKEILAIDNLVNAEDSYVQIAHIDINGVTETLTDNMPAFDTNFIVNKAQHYLMTKLIKKGALLFFIGGDNFMSPCNGLSPQELTEIIEKIKDEIGIGHKAGIGRSNNAEDAAYLADLGLEIIREEDKTKIVHIFEDETTKKQSNTKS
ncbi:MAG: GTP cyclohydrolase IIa [Methanobrevibacter sp.]|nr:GTP cyclohydrolase IIa [Candidatus Methanovirga basalitermitum]